MSRGSLLGLGLVLVLGTVARAQQPATSPTSTEAEVVDLFLQANSAYRAGQFPRAVGLYEAVLSRGVDNGWVHYNLGNSYLKAGRLGEAIAAYRRSHSLLPRHGDVVANLAFARRSIKDAIAPPTATNVLHTIFFWHYGLSRPELLKLVVLLNVLFFGVLTWRLYRRATEPVRWLTWGLAAVLLAMGTSLLIRTFVPTRVAVVKEPEIDVHAGTSRDTVVRFRLHEGTEMTLVEADGDWLRIELSDGKQGWVTQTDVETLSL